MKKIFLIIALVFLALFLAAELYVQSDLFALQIRPVVLGHLKQVLGSDAQIGWIRANLFPLYLEARDIALLDRSGRPTATLRKVKVYINPVPLLFRKLRLPSIVLVEPRIFAERSNDGRFNMTPVLDRIRENINRMPQNASGFKVLLRSMSVHDGSILFKDGLTGAQLTVSRIQAAAKVSLAGESLIIALKQSELSMSAPAYPDFSGRLQAAARYDHGRLYLERVDLSTADTALSVAGTIGALPDPALNLRISARSGPETLEKLKGILKYLKKERRFRVEASATVKGTLSKPSAAGVFQLTGVSYEGFLLQDAAVNFDYRDNQLAVNGGKWKISRGARSILVDSVDALFGHSSNGFEIRSFKILAGDLSCSLMGRADMQRGFDSVVTAESSGKGKTLSFLTTVPVEGRIRAKGFLTGAVNTPLIDGEFSADSLIVRGITFDNAAGRIQYRDKTLSLVSVDIHEKSSRYMFNGSIDIGKKEPVFSARLKAIRSDVASIVALFYERLPLSISATGDLTFNGTAHDFTGSARLNVEAGSAYGEAFTKGTVTAALTKDRIAFSSVTVNKGSGTVTGTGWIGFDGTYAASIESSDVRLEEVGLLTGSPLGGAFHLVIESSGSFSRPLVAASLEMDDFLLSRTSFGGMNADLKIRDRELAVTAHLDKRADLNARLALNKPYAWRIQTTINNGAFDPLILSGKQELTGRVSVSADGSVSLQGRGGAISNMTGRASFRRLSAVIGDYRIDNDGPAEVSIQGDRLIISSLNFNGEGTKIAATGSARWMKEMDLSLRGKARLSLLRPLLRDLEHSDGTAEVRLTVTADAWSEPQVDGEVQIQNGEIKIKDVPQKFSALNGKASFDQNRVVVERLTGEFGGGTLTASGKAGLLNLKLSEFSSRVSFENVSVRYPEGLVSTLSGDLYYDGGAEDQSLTGDILIKRARYDKRIEWKSMLVDIGKGLYQKKRSETGWVGETQINVRFYGKENILFQNNLAKMPLEVDMFLRGSVNHPQLLGRIEARKGSVYFRQNEFKIVHGSVDFVDPNRMNPVLDIQAEIQVREFLIRLAVSGTADHAVVTLLSDPQRSDSDILALLALGKTGSELKGKETGVGMSEAASFATGQFQDIFESRARSLTGLDRFQVDPYVSKGDTSVPRVTVGKEIVQDRLYVTYSSNVGATMPEQIFRIEYVLNKHFALVGERNELGNTGADIKYRFEFK